MRHLFRRERVIGLHRGMAGHRCGDALQRFVHAGAPVEALKVLGHRPNRRLTLRAAQERRDRCDANGFASKLLQLKSHALESGGMGDQGLTRGRGQVDEHRLEQALTLERSVGQPLHDLLEQHALVGDVLIDNRNALLVHGDDERVAELAQRNHWTNRGRCFGARCEGAMVRQGVRRCPAGPNGPTARKGAGVRSG